MSDQRREQTRHNHLDYIPSPGFSQSMLVTPLNGTSGMQYPQEEQGQVGHC
jgi:hypothetical protein